MTVFPIIIEEFDKTYLKVILPDDVVESFKKAFTWNKKGTKANYYTPEPTCFYNQYTNLIGIGFRKRIEAFLNDKGLEYEYRHCHGNISTSGDDALTIFDRFPFPFEPDEFQRQAIKRAIDDKNILILSPTSSGKSLIIFGISIYAASKKFRILILVPLVSLVTQLEENFAEYGAPPELIQPIHSKANKGWKSKIQAPIVVTTWQSVKNKPQSWFENFDMVLGDEAHGFGSPKTSEIVRKCTKAIWKIGLTGTQPDDEYTTAHVESLFGYEYSTITTSELIEMGRVSIPHVTSITLKYTSKEVSYFQQNRVDYKAEIDWLCNHDERNDFLKRLALSLNGNTILLYRYVMRHGLLVYERLKESTNRPVYFISGNTDADIRDEMTANMEQHNNSILVASYGTLSTGVSINNIDNAILASPVKSRVTTLQSIGRTLRLQKERVDMDGDKYKNDTAQIFDINDDLTENQKPNYAKRHANERLGYYHEQKIPYTKKEYKL